MGDRKSPKMLAIEAEYHQPFWDVVKGFADDGESIQATAGILGYCPSAFRRLVTRHKRTDWFARHQQSAGAKAAREARRGIVTPGMARALEAAMVANPGYTRVALDGVTDTIAGHARRRGMSVRTVYNRMRRGQTPAQALTPGHQYVSRPVPRTHHWRATAQRAQ